MEKTYWFDIANWQNPTASQAGPAFFGIMFSIILIIASFKLADNGITGWFNLIICLLGVAFGWLIGIALSPYDTVEHDVFSTVAKTVSVFVSGYLISKLDQPLNALITKLTSSINTSPNGLGDFKPSKFNAFRIIAFVMSLVCSSIVVYSARAYDQQRFAKEILTKKAIADSVTIAKVSVKVDSLEKINKGIKKNLDSLKRVNK